MYLDNFYFYLNRKLLKDPWSRRKLQQQQPVLSQTQTKVLTELQKQGVAMIPFDELFKDRPEYRWEEVAFFVDSFTQSKKVEQAIETYKKEFSRWLEEGSPKDREPCDYVVWDDDPHPHLDLEDPLFRLGWDSTILNIVNSYLGLWTKLNQYSVYYNIPMENESRKRMRAQRWHRDMWNQVKVFFYFSDVTEGSGALEYIPGSLPGRSYASLWRFSKGKGPPGYLQPPEDLIEHSVPQKDRIYCSFPRGSILFCDTDGLHRGGFVRTHPRVMASWAYYAPSAPVAKSFVYEHSAILESIPEPARFALT